MPAWLDGTALRPHAETLLGDLCRTQRDGLAAAAYRPNVLRSALDHLDEAPLPDAAARVDLQFTWTFMQYSHDLLKGRVDPQTLGSEVYLDVPPVALDSVLAQLLSGPPPASFREALTPGHPHYARLQDALRRYRALADRGGWPLVEEGALLEPGVRDGRLPALRRRLALTGDLDEAHAARDSLFDETVQAAVAHFQARHGLAVDSVVGPSTRAALNVPVEARIRQIERNMERWRWLPHDLGERYVVVNIPAFRVYGYENGRPALSMRVVLGAEYGGRQTPVFSDRMDHVIFRPYWHVPYNITHNEILPQARKDDTYLSDNGYEAVDSRGNVVSGRNVDLDEVASGRYRIRQRPGRSNALGLVKFMFPNAHSIYLHDTPADYLFERRERDFSHGCIRLEDPVRFAEYVLGPQGWTPDRIRAALAAENRERVDLEEPIPVYLMYLTVFVSDEGRVSFRKDLYGYDEALEDALADHARQTRNRAGARTTFCRLLRHIQAKSST